MGFSIMQDYEDIIKALQRYITDASAWSNELRSAVELYMAYMHTDPVARAQCDKIQTGIKAIVESFNLIGDIIPKLQRELDYLMGAVQKIEVTSAEEKE